MWAHTTEIIVKPAFCLTSDTTNIVTAGRNANPCKFIWSLKRRDKVGSKWKRCRSRGSTSLHADEPALGWTRWTRGRATTRWAESRGGPSIHSSVWHESVLPSPHWPSWSMTLQGSNETSSVWVRNYPRGYLSPGFLIVFSCCAFNWSFKLVAADPEKWHESRWLIRSTSKQARSETTVNQQQQITSVCSFSSIDLTQYSGEENCAFSSIFFFWIN